MNKELELKIAALQKDIEFTKSIRDVYRRGVIESVSVQGDMLYAIIRKAPGKYLKTSEKNIKNSVTGFDEDNSYFGNIHNISEKDLTLTELLIPTDINFKAIHVHPSKFIGARVLVWLIGNIPQKAFILSPLLRSRLINPDDIRYARALSKKDKNNSKKYGKNLTEIGYEFLLARGYSKKQILTTFEEEVPDKGSIITYGVKDWQDESDSSNSNVDMSDSLENGIVNHVYSNKKDEKTICYKSLKALLAL